MRACANTKLRQRTATASLAALLALGVTGPSFGQAPVGPNGGSPPMFALPQGPNPLGQPYLQPDGYVKDSAIVPAAPLRPEDRAYADYNAAKMKGWVKEITDLSIKDRKSGNIYWGRNFGTLGHQLAEDWTEAQFKRLGMSNIHRVVEGSPRPMFTPHSYDISFQADGQTFKLVSARPSQSTSTTIDADLIWLGLGSDADFKGRDVKGKAVLIQDIPLPGDIRHTATMEGAIKRAYANGAAAVGVIFGVSDNFSLWQSTDGKPGFNLGYSDGMKLRDMLGKGQTVHLKYKLDAEFKADLKSASVYGELPGTTDEKMIIVAHLDGYFESGLDNASGMAIMIAMAEHYAKIPQSQRRRTIIFDGSIGHHGGPGTRKLHETTDWSKVAYVINLEHVAVNRTELWGPTLRMSTGPAPLRWALNASPAVFKIMDEGLRRFNVPVDAEIDSTVGEISAIYQDAPSLSLITSPEIKHTEQDTAEWVPGEGLLAVARAHSWILDRVNKMDRKDIMFGTWPPNSGRAAAGGDD